MAAEWSQSMKTGSGTITPPVDRGLRYDLQIALTVFRQARVVVLPIITTIIILAIWEAGVRLFHVSPVVLPAPSLIGANLVSNFGLLMHHAAQTTSEAAIGLCLAVSIGFCCGFALAYSPMFREATYPHMVFFQLTPKVALAPLFIMWLGVGAESRLAFTVFIAFFPILVSTAAGLTNVDESYIRFSKAITASTWQTFLHIRLPFALPHIFAGFKIGVTMSFIGIIVGEFITSQAGLGYLILFASTRAATATIFASILVLGVIGMLFYALVVLVEKLVLRRYGSR
jgi:NitT/TauT family transport system permease protein